MILGWDDQKPGGLEHSLVDTGLLDRRKSNPPRCYVYKDMDSATNAAIVGWSPGFEDGGPMVRRRKFPVMFLYVLSAIAPCPYDPPPLNPDKIFFYPQPPSTKL